MRRQRIKGLFDQRVIAQRTRGHPQSGQPRRTMRITGKKTMQIGATDTAISRDRAVDTTVIQSQQRSLRSGADGSADMHFVTGHGDIVGDGAAVDRD